MAPGCMVVQSKLPKAAYQCTTILPEVTKFFSRCVGQNAAVVSHSNRRQLETEVKMAVQSHLTELSEKHRNLERRIEQEMARPGADPTKIGTLKRQKLKLKDQIVRLTNKTTH